MTSREAEEVAARSQKPKGKKQKTEKRFGGTERKNENAGRPNNLKNK